MKDKDVQQKQYSRARCGTLSLDSLVNHILMVRINLGHKAGEKMAESRYFENSMHGRDKIYK